MVENIYFTGEPTRRVGDVSRIVPVNHNSGNDHSNGQSFQEVLAQKKAVRDKKPVSKPADSVPIDTANAYGFVNYYNGKAQSTFFYMMNSYADLRA